MRSAALRGIGALAALATVVWAPAAEATKPDLVVRSLAAAPATVAAGGVFTLTDVVANEGRRRAGASRAEYVLAARKRRIRLGGRAVPALARREESSGRLELAVPATARDGAYALVACADARHEVRERREDNNCRSARERLVVDTAPPVAAVLGERPDAATKRTAASIAFSHPERGVTFACRLDGGAERACTSPYEAVDLAEGPHRFEVRAIDAAGNRGPVATVEWTVDLTPPLAAVIDERPAQVTTANGARFAFHGEEPGVRFRCALDDAEPSDCQSPVEYAALPDEEHAFTVFALDAAGNTSEPLQVGWTIVPDQGTLGDGAWCWFADPRAVRFSGLRRRTYVGWTAQNGDIEIAAYDHDSLVRTTARLGNETPVDDHNNPAIQILPDGRVRVYWSEHGGAELWYRTSLAPEDITAWGRSSVWARPALATTATRTRTPSISAPRRQRICSGAAGTGTRRSRCRLTARTPGSRRRTSSTSRASAHT